MPRVAILYGFAEGPRIATKLANTLKQQGFRIVQDYATADIIIAHSSGCFALPAQTEGKTVLLVAPPSGWQGKWHIVPGVKKVRHDLSHARQNKHVAEWLRKSFWNSVYLVWFARHIPRILRASHTYRHTLPDVQARKTVVIVYPGDPWTHALPPDIVERHPLYCFIGHPGGHDDLWHHPQKYADILQYVHET